MWCACTSARARAVRARVCSVCVCVRSTRRMIDREAGNIAPGWRVRACACVSRWSIFSLSDACYGALDPGKRPTAVKNCTSSMPSATMIAAVCLKARTRKFWTSLQNLGFWLQRVCKSPSAHLTGLPGARDAPKQVVVSHPCLFRQVTQNQGVPHPFSSAPHRLHTCRLRSCSVLPRRSAPLYSPAHGAPSRTWG
jgi:hypothetical protein